MWRSGSVSGAVVDDGVVEVHLGYEDDGGIDAENFELGIWLERLSGGSVAVVRVWEQLVALPRKQVLWEI